MKGKTKRTKKFSSDSYGTHGINVPPKLKSKKKKLLKTREFRLDGCNTVKSENAFKNRMGRAQGEGQ